MFCIHFISDAFFSLFGFIKVEEENHMKRRAFFLILLTNVSVVIICVPFTISGFSFILAQHYVKVLFLFIFF